MISLDVANMTYQSEWNAPMTIYTDLPNRAACVALTNTDKLKQIPPIRGSPLPTGDVCCSSLIAKHPDSAPSEK